MADDVRSLRVAGIVVVSSPRSMGIWRAAQSLTDALQAIGIDAELRASALSNTPAHFHYGNSTRNLLPSLLRRRGDVVSMHDAIPRHPRLRAGLGRLQARAAARHHVVAHSQHAVELLETMGWTGEATIVKSLLPVATIDPDRVASLRRSWNSDDYDLTLVSAGQIRATKGVDEIIAAARDHGSIRVVLVGSVAGHEVRERVASAPSNVLQLEAIDDVDFCHALAAADGVLSIRRGSVGETSGPVVQAHRLLRPVLGFDVGSLPETCGPGDVLLQPSATVTDLFEVALRQGLPSISPDSSQVPRPEEVARDLVALYRRVGFDV